MEHDETPNERTLGRRTDRWLTVSETIVGRVAPPPCTREIAAALRDRQTLTGNDIQRRVGNLGPRESARRLAPDEISAVIGDPRRVERYAPRELRERILGPHSRETIAISRFHFLARPPIAVDFEPAVGRMFPTEKRRWCAQHGIVYVPVFLFERLTAEQFRARIRSERKAMEEIRRDTAEDRALAAVKSSVADSEVDGEALRRLHEELRRNPNLRGATRARRLTTLKRQVVREKARRKNRHHHAR